MTLRYFPARYAPAGAMALCTLLFAANLVAQYGRVPEAFYQRYLYEPECEAVGSGLRKGEDTTATSDEYLAPNGAVFPDGAPGDDPAGYVRLHFDPQADAAGEYDYEPYFRLRQTEPGPVSLWLRTNGGDWTLRTYTTAYARTADGGWTWVPDVLVHDEENILGLQGDTLLTLDVAFTRADQQLDQVYLESVNFSDYHYSTLRPFAYDLPGTNCPDFTNLPPVAILEPGFETIVTPRSGPLYLSAAESYDPDGVVVNYDFTTTSGEWDWGNLDPSQPDILLYFPDGITLITVTVYDFYGASALDSTLYNLIHRDNGMGNGPYYRVDVECAEVGSNWTLTDHPRRPGDLIAVAPAEPSANQVAEDIPENKLRFVIPDVPEDYDAYGSRYHMMGVFTQPQPEWNCLWVNFNGTGWHRWEVIDAVSIYANIPMQPGDNVVELAYCSANLGLEYLNFSPEIGISHPYTIYEGLGDATWIRDVTCDEPLASEFWLEAECADYGERWQLRNATGASRGGYLVVDGPNAYSSPPADDPANYVRFPVEHAAAGTYYLQARINAPSSLDDSYYVRVNEGPWYAWKSGIRRKGGFQWNLLPGGGVTLEEGANTIDFAYREDGTELDKIYLGPTAALLSGTGGEASDCPAPVMQPVVEWLEAECAPHGGAWTIRQDSDASNGAYLVALTGNSLKVPPPSLPENLITFHLDVPDYGQEQQLFLYGRIAAAAPDDDSFWVRLNGGQWYAWNSLKHGPGVFQWNRLPLTLPATPGVRHTIEFAYRENGTWLDGIYVTSLDAPPSALLAPGYACGAAGSEVAAEASVSPAPTAVASGMEMSLYPNPVLDELTLELNGDYAGPLHGKVYDAAGRVLRTVTYEKEAGPFRTLLRVSELPAGVYRLRIIQGDRQSVQTFLRL
ncbi:hypothetical protein GGR26_002019 [Lewinella marina]|uniref:Secretion system C-terminal sorting domain-containing protein n=1 Tax=Neolewinella marina TaxID=438751 RepID=A0A2G0CH18_9BACT|nr:T9SS type A sorting domain-containing protein [Neolewinella marina]NJB86251.1 hypothetical protein [Neolewinella marina]PHK99275.1 hypothetical protein CGL56_07415 [Neolewinella marina]